MQNKNLFIANASKNPAIRAQQQKEADEFNALGLSYRDLSVELELTNNPILKRKISDMMKEWKERRSKSQMQNQMNFDKLDEFKRSALGVGLRKVQKMLKEYTFTHDDYEAEIVELLLELEFANIEAKRHTGEVKRKIYERKCILLERLEPMLYDCGWKYGVNYANGKNASYLIFIYLPNGKQLTWHCNEFELANQYPYIEAEWDGQVCSTMEKIVSYIEESFFGSIAA